MPGILPFGMIAGVAAAEAEYSLVQALGASTLLFAGASQLAVAQLTMQQALPVVAILTVWVINMRFAMYSASLATHMGQLPVGQRYGLAYLVTDQAYALGITRFNDGRVPPQGRVVFYLGIGIPLWTLWQLANALGFLLGESLPADWQLGFAISLIFLSLIVPNVTSRPSLAAALVGATVSVAAMDWPFNTGLLAGALSGIATGLLLEQRLAAAGSDNGGKDG